MILLLIQLRVKLSYVFNIVPYGIYMNTFLFISKKPSYKEIWSLSTFRGSCFLNISVTEAYILKRDIFYCPVCNVFEQQ